MGAPFFGQWLLNKGVIDPVQLANGVVMQERANLKLGQLATQTGWMTEAQVLEIVRLQKNEDIYFGEAAQRLGFLTPEQVKGLLDKQRFLHLYIGEALVRLGALTPEQRDRELVLFQAEEQAKLAVKDVFAECVVQLYPDVMAYVRDFYEATVTTLQRMAGITAKFGNCEKKIGKVPLTSVSVLMKFSGRWAEERFPAFILLPSPAMAATLAKKICQCYGMDDDPAMADDSLRELVNVICGQACNKIASIADLKVTPPRTCQMSTAHLLSPEESGLQLKLETTHGPISFLLVVRTAKV